MQFRIYKKLLLNVKSTLKKSDNFFLLIKAQAFHYAFIRVD